MTTLPALSLMSVLAWQLAAQTPPPDPELQEQYELTLAMNDAGTSPVDIIRNLEAFLKKYPAPKQLHEIEQTLAKAAMDSGDAARIVLYGEKVLRSGGRDDLGLIDRVTRVLVDSSDPEQQRKAAAYAKRYESDVVLRGSDNPPGHLTPGQWADEIARALARARVLEARAMGIAGGAEAGAEMAVKSWETWPTGEGAREVGYWLAKLDENLEAIQYYADAFTLEDARTTEADRANDRRRLGELYSKVSGGSEQGLGDIILQAYDHTSALMNARREALQAREPNAIAAGIEDFVLPAVEGTAPALDVSSLKGKTVVMDFWATWCAPCRAQEPLIENVKKHFEDAKDIVFVSVDADDDTSLVAPFLKQQGWKDLGYFEAGLAQRMVISAIPTVLVLDPAGRIYSRITGFVPERFEQMLMQRIEDARRNP